MATSKPRVVEEDAPREYEIPEVLRELLSDPCLQLIVRQALGEEKQIIARSFEDEVVFASVSTKDAGFVP